MAVDPWRINFGKAVEKRRLRTLGVSYWRTVTENCDRDAWKRIVNEANAHPDDECRKMMMSRKTFVVPETIDTVRQLKTPELHVSCYEIET